jgi:hypothetical protein
VSGRSALLPDLRPDPASERGDPIRPGCVVDAGLTNIDVLLGRNLKLYALALYTDLLEHEAFTNLETWGATDLGMVTGKAC